MSQERHVSVSHSDLESLDAALSWAVQAHDREFTKATMVKISVEQTMRSDGGGDWRYVWTAAVSGCTEETTDA